MPPPTTTTPVLIHIPNSYGKPAGAWRLEHHELVAHYHPDAPEHHITRARTALTAKGTTVPTEHWFRQLADKVPYTDDYEVIDADPTDTLTDILNRVSTAWST